MKQEMPKQTVVGKITSVYGIKGWVKVMSYTEPMDNLLRYRTVCLEQQGVRREAVLEAGKRHGKGLVAKFKGYDDPESARPICGSLIMVDVDQLPRLDDGEYYWHQLEGLRVITQAGDELGRVDHLLETGANDVLVVRGTASSIDQRERLIPYLPEQVVLEVDLADGIMRVDWDPGF